jgi:hypothetical protein
MSLQVTAREAGDFLERELRDPNWNNYDHLGGYEVLIFGGGANAGDGLACLDSEIWKVGDWLEESGGSIVFLGGALRKEWDFVREVTGIEFEPVDDVFSAPEPLDDVFEVEEALCARGWAGSATVLAESEEGLPYCVVRRGIAVIEGGRVGKLSPGEERFLVNLVSGLADIV